MHAAESMHPNALPDERCRELIDSACKDLGYTSAHWVAQHVQLAFEHGVRVGHAQALTQVSEEMARR